MEEVRSDGRLVLNPVVVSTDFASWAWTLVSPSTFGTTAVNAAPAKKDNGPKVGGKCVKRFLAE